MQGCLPLVNAGMNKRSIILKKSDEVQDERNLWFGGVGEVGAVKC